jgi:hypothetical protein
MKTLQYFIKVFSTYQNIHQPLHQKIFISSFRNTKRSIARKLASEIMVDKETDEIDIYNQLKEIK